MPNFSNKSIDALRTCHPKLIALFQEVIKVYNCSILEGFRSEEKQAEMLRMGFSRLSWPRSLHNQTPSRAIDVVPYPINWKDAKRFYHFAGWVQGVAYLSSIKIRWGGDWDSDRDLNDQNFMDLAHFELGPDEQ